MIKKRTRWAFTKFAITNIIAQIIQEIENEKVQKANEELARRAANPNPFMPAEIRHA